MFTLDEVVPWGRSFREYCRMFALAPADEDKHILGCADGPASFNAEATSRGWTVVSCDPLYRFTADEIRTRINATFPVILEQTRKNSSEFHWSNDIPDVDALGTLRRNAMNDFLADYEAGRAAGRYVVAELPALPFAEAAFDLALCSHFLFLYSEHLSEEFHSRSIRDLARVAREVRVFPLLELGGRQSRHLEGVVARLRQAGFLASIEGVTYEFQRGGNQMLRVIRPD